MQEGHKAKGEKNEKKQMLNNLNQVINPIMKQFDKDNNSLEMPQLALRCAEFFHSVSQYCVGYYRNYVKEDEIKKTKHIKKMDKEKEQKASRRNRKKENHREDHDNQKQKNLEPPKKPLTAYIIYFQDKKPLFVERYSSLNLSELTKLIAKEWKELSEAEKQVYLDKAAEDRKRYDEELTQFKALFGKNLEDIEMKDENLEEEDIQDLINSEENQEPQMKQQGNLIEAEIEVDVVNQDEGDSEEDREDDAEGDGEGNGEGEDAGAAESDSEAEQNGINGASEQQSEDAEQSPAEMSQSQAEAQA